MRGNGKWAYVTENEPVKRFCIFFPRLWLWQWVSFKMWPFHTHKEHIKHTLCSRKVLTEVRFMRWSLDFQIQTNSDTEMRLIYNLLVVITSAGRSIKTVYLSKRTYCTVIIQVKVLKHWNLLRVSREALWMARLLTAVCLRQSQL